MPTRFNTPMISKRAVDVVTERMAHDEKNLLTLDWENDMASPCIKCNGTGKDLEFAHTDDPHCYNCEGTGVKYVEYYGISNGKPYRYLDEWGIDFLKLVCKDEREKFEAIQKAGKVGELKAIRPYYMPEVIKLEFMARGYEEEDFTDGKKIKEIANIMAREYPDFMCVPYKNF